MMKIAIAGVGVLGSILGGYLTAGGQNVTLICTSWRAQAEALKKRGLIIRSDSGERRISVKALFIDELDAVSDRFDLLIIATKANFTLYTMNLVMPWLTNEATVMSCQNGINEDFIELIWPRKNTIGCVTRMGGIMPEPGLVCETNSGEIGFIVGELDGNITARIREIAGITGLCRETRISDNIFLERWTKLAQNCMATPLAAITGLSLRELHASDHAHRIFARILVETTDVAAAVGYNVSSVSGLDIATWRRLVREAFPDVDRKLTEAGAVFGQSAGSMLPDILKGRPTEIDFINGYVVKRGQELKIGTPVNQKVVDMVKAVETGSSSPCPENLEYLYDYIFSI